MDEALYYSSQAWRADTEDNYYYPGDQTRYGFVVPDDDDVHRTMMELCSPKKWKCGSRCEMWFP